MPFKTRLLDPEAWADVLDVYARTVKVAAALMDHDGRLVGKCHNPQPVWTMAREARPDLVSGCIFCLDDGEHCTAAADVEQTGSLALVTGPGGFVHVAAPLFLAGQHMGTLVAGQVFDRRADASRVERFARQFGLSTRNVWNVARQCTPVSQADLTAYGNLLCTLGQAFLRERYSTILKVTLAETNKKLKSINEDLKDVNSKLTGKITELDQSNAEKDVLLNEVHHRVNNNLQVIASLLRMQAETTPDGQAAMALRESQLRVESMALIHAQLYHSVDWRAVNFAEYTSILVVNLFHSYGVNETRIGWRVDIGPMELSVDKAIPAGLILNELISNSLKHAFPDGRNGTIVVHGRYQDGRIELSVEDDGVGTQLITKPRRRQSLGLKIVSILCRQLKGTFAQPHGSEEADTGSLYRISFPYNTTSK